MGHGRMHGDPGGLLAVQSIRDTIAEVSRESRVTLKPTAGTSQTFQALVA